MNETDGYDFLYKLSYKSGPECDFTGSTREEFDIWKAQTLEKVKTMFGFDRLQSVPYNAEKLESEELVSAGGKEYTRELYMLDTLEGLKMPIFVLRPKEGNNKAALALHPHGSDGKNGIVGIVKEAIKEKEARFGYSYALDLLEKGYTVFCPDMLGAGSRKPISTENPEKCDCTAINNSLMSIGLNLPGVTTFELKRAVDFIYEYGVDTDDLLCIGFSGGGLATLWLAAVDERIKTAYISGYFHSLRGTLLHSNFCGCNFAPNMWKIVDLDSAAMLIAPRKLYIETGADDTLNGREGLSGVMELVDKVEYVYKDIFAADNFKFKACDGKHKWYGAFINEF